MPKAQKNIKTNLKKKNKDPWNKWTINSKSIITIIENLKHTHLRKSAFQTIGFLMKTKVHLTFTALNTQASNTEQLSFLRTIVILLSHLQWTKLKISYGFPNIWFMDPGIFVLNYISIITIINLSRSRTFNKFFNKFFAKRLLYHFPVVTFSKVLK